jgi:exosortase J
MFLLLWLARHKQQNPVLEETAPDSTMRRPRIGTVYIKCAAFALTLLIALSLPSSALKYRQAAKATPTSFAALMPKQIGGFTLTRTWYEQTGGITVEENGAYSAPGSDEIILGVWVMPFYYAHNANDCWLARGLQPDILTTRQFLTAGGESRTLNTGFYSDGITESIVVNAVCTPGSCLQFQPAGSSKRMGFLFLEPQVGELAGSGQHPVSIMIRIDKLHSSTQKSVNYDLLAAEARTFLAGLDPTSLSKAFQ